MLFLCGITLFLWTVSCQTSKYTLGAQGESCNEACFNLAMNCNSTIITNNNTDLFSQLGISCIGDNQPWSSENEPCYVSALEDPNYGKCMGYVNIPAGIQCSGSSPTTQRLCRCDDPSTSPSTFGASYSNGTITTEETWIFEYILVPGDVGVLTHFWVTYASEVDDGVLIRYYIDGEDNASIQFIPSLACGVGYYDTQSPWGTEWIGKGADDGGWYNNFRIPFQKSIIVTIQHLYANYTGFYMIIHGSLNIPIFVGGIQLPNNSRMNQYVINSTFQPLQWVSLVNISSGAGVHWMVTISAESENLNFLEGCFHGYFDGNNQFPGVILATGTEDYFDSAWYFNGGEFHLPVSGFTHFSQPVSTDIFIDLIIRVIGLLVYVYGIKAYMTKSLLLWRIFIGFIILYLAPLGYNAYSAFQNANWFALVIDFLLVIFNTLLLFPSLSLQTFLKIRIQEKAQESDDEQKSMVL